jgi:hypothetical protein
MSAEEVLSAFRRDAPYLFLGGGRAAYSVSERTETENE